MNDLMMKAYEPITSMLPFLLTLISLSIIYKRKGNRTTTSHVLMVVIFAFYISAVFYFTGTGTIYDALRYGNESNPSQINVVPFSNSMDVVAYVLNILLFVPFGFLLPFIWPNTNKFWVVLPFGFGFSLLIEISQLCNNRRTDVDDLILNTLGALVGYLLFLLFAWLTKRKPAQTKYCKWEPLLYVGIMFVGRFFLYNEFGLAKILYNL